MNCDVCDRKMNYAFYLDARFWEKVVGPEAFRANKGILCAHCALEKLGGVEWRIEWGKPVNEQITVAALDLTVDEFEEVVRKHGLG